MSKRCQVNSEKKLTSQLRVTTASPEKPVFPGKFSNQHSNSRESKVFALFTAEGDEIRGMGIPRAYSRFAHLAADEQSATIQLNDAAQTERNVPYEKIDRARTVFEWGPAPKPGNRL